MSSRQRVGAVAKALGVSVQAGLRYPGPRATRPPVRNIPQQMKHTMFSAACIRRVRSWGAATGNANRTSVGSRTPQTLPELANMLRHPEGRLRCPFGIDWEDEPGGVSRLDRHHRIPYWLALLELHEDGYRYGMESERSLPVVFDRLIECLEQKRRARMQAPKGASEHLISTSDDLKTALLNNPVFTDKIATHDLLSYSLKESVKYLAVITTEKCATGQRAHGLWVPAAG